MNCYLSKPPSPPTIIIRRSASIGDVLASTVVADQLATMGYNVHFQSNPNTHCVLRRCPNVSSIGEPNGHAPHVDLNGAYENDALRRRKHFHQMFFEMANAHLDSMGICLGAPVNCRPRLRILDQERARAFEFFKQWPRPWVFICPRSNSFRVRTVPDPIWEQIAARTHGTKFWLGNHGDAPNGIVDLKMRHFDRIIEYLSVADLLVSVDTGPMHIAAAIGVPVIAIGQSASPETHLSNQVDFETISPPLDCLNCQLNECPISMAHPPCQNINPQLVADRVNTRMAGLKISAVVAIWQPQAHTLNHCLQNTLPQVDEIVVACESGSVIPDGAMRNDKIKYVRYPHKNVGYAKNANHGARHTSGEWLWFLNDDCYPNPDAAQRMLECADFKTGAIGQMLVFRDDTIQHAGMTRNVNGGVGYGHIDFKRPRSECSIKEVREMECVTGASMLVRRKAFFDVGAFPENYFLYSEDTDFCMTLRKGGWKIMYTPHALGVHDEHQSTSKVPRLDMVLEDSNRIFHNKWAGYFEHNKGNHGLGGFDY